MQNLVILTGAGISAESGLKTFRDSDGLWEGYNIEDVATLEAFTRNPKLVLDFYNQRRKSVLNAQPNRAHYGLVELEKKYNVSIITQNIDDLHERAGSKNILHLHGEIFKMRSVNNYFKTYQITGDINLGDTDSEGFQLRPHIVWFGEAVPAMQQAIPIVKQADIFVVIGTSLVVYPAAGLVDEIQPRTPIYVLDKKIPPLKSRDIVAIEDSACNGIEKLVDYLM